MHAVFTVLHSMPAYLHGKAHFKLNASKVAGLSARVMQPPAHFLLSGSSVLGKMGTPPHHLISPQCFINAQRHTFFKALNKKGYPRRIFLIVKGRRNQFWSKHLIDNTTAVCNF